MSSLPKRGVLVAMVTPYGEGEGAISAASREGDARYRWRGRRGPGSPRHRRTFCHVFVSNETTLARAIFDSFFLFFFLFDWGRRGVRRIFRIGEFLGFTRGFEEEEIRFDSMESLLVSHALFRRVGVVFLVGREKEGERVIWFGSGYLSDCAELVILLVEN